MSNIRTVIFDLDDTLIHSGIDSKRMKASLIKFLVKVGVESNLLNESMPNLEIFRVSAESLRRKNFRENEIKSILERASLILDGVEMESLGNARLMDGALETLLALKRRGFKIGIITNGCRSYASEIIRIFSMEDYIDALVTRDDVDNPKPSPEHLLKALEILGVSPNESIFVGDHWIDALCAKEAGVKFILLKSGKRGDERGSNSKNAENMAASIISGLRELLRLLKE
ncbi:MAG: HAD family hydrolase [Candidatus Bathyarchaeia archaeon]